MANLAQKFLTRARHNGWSPPLLALGAAALLAAAAAVDGAKGVAFTLALGCAFLLGTAARAGTFHLRSLVETPDPQPVDRALLQARIDADAGPQRPLGASLCLVLQLDDHPALLAQHGLRAGRLMARTIARRLQQGIRPGDTLADLGAGRFAVYLPPSPRIDLETAIQTALRLQASVQQGMPVDGLRLHVTASLGFCLSTRLAGPARGPTLLEAADLALARAQRDAPGAIRAYDHTMAPAPGTTLASAPPPDLARALTAGQIVPWYQPQLCADTGALTGVEALARWLHPQRGPLTPAHFLPEIVALGLSARLTDTMLDQALGQIATWDRSGVHVPRVGLNLGPEDLADPGLVDRVTWALDRHGLPPARLAIEVLETVAADPDAIAGRSLLALGGLGCHIDLDDFGTGSASINGIRRFGVHRLKLDRSLITAVDTDPDQHAMLTAVLTMARQLDVDVLAEGVETPGEHSVLAQLGCGHVQGYAIARPMPACDLLDWMLRRGDGPDPVPPALATPRRLRRNAARTPLGGKTA